ncbi:uncharacterized protein LOC132904055, partial [Amyelois transitella]|uniref:uncharacterized protein LOC132904055 n=1 Tax=Amyelois transitella TaxID=680683 RepID=UPI00299040FE
MTDIVKCNECNIVINAMLSYIQNKISVIDEESLVRICVSAFTTDEIKKSKSLLFNAVPAERRQIQRKRKGKEGRDMEDIIMLFKSTDPEIIPVFVAKQLEKLPPITFDHLDCTKLLKDLTRMSAEIENIKTTYATVNQVEELKRDLNQRFLTSIPATPCFSNINVKRGAWGRNSGPMGISQFQNSTLNESRNLMTSVCESNKNELQYRSIKACSIESAGKQSPPPPQSTLTVSCDEVPNSGAGLVTHASIETQQENYLCPEQLTDVNTVPCDNEYVGPWQMKTRGKNKLRFSGMTGQACEDDKFKAAVRFTPIFISNIHNDTNKTDIVEYILKKTQERVELEKISIKKHNNHLAYKFVVPENKLSLFLDDKIWPRGIIFRRFVNYKHRH